MGPPSSMMGPVVSMGGHHMGPSGPGGQMGGPISPMGPGGGPMMSMNTSPHPPNEQPSPPNSGPKRKRKNGLKAGGAPMPGAAAGPGPVGPPGSLMMGPAGAGLGPQVNMVHVGPKEGRPAETEGQIEKD